VHPDDRAPLLRGDLDGDQRHLTFFCEGSGLPRCCAMPHRPPLGSFHSDLEPRAEVSARSWTRRAQARAVAAQMPRPSSRALAAVLRDHLTRLRARTRIISRWRRSSAMPAPACGFLARRPSAVPAPARRQVRVIRRHPGGEVISPYPGVLTSRGPSRVVRHQLVIGDGSTCCAPRSDRQRVVIHTDCPHRLRRDGTCGVSSACSRHPLITQPRP